MDNFSFGGEASAPFLPTLSNGNSGETSVFSDGNLQNLIPSPVDFSIGRWPHLDFPAYYKSIQNSDSQLLFSNFASQTLKIPKQEQISPLLFNPEDSKLATDFFSRNLPGIQSLESSTGFDSLFPNLSSSQQTFDSVVENLKPPKKRVRQRSQRISDKYRSLQKLMPWERRMDTTTMLEEAYKYIKFLQGQVKVLEMMPVESRFNSDSGALGSVFGEIGMLNRQKLLQVVLNTPEAQTRLYSQGCCVYSSEQLVALKNFAERRAALQQLMFHSSINS